MPLVPPAPQPIFLAGTLGGEKIAGCLHQRQPTSIAQRTVTCWPFHLALRWLDDQAFAARFDVVVIYFGKNDSFACPQCLKVFRDSGPK